MDTPSDKPSASWEKLTASARRVQPPQDIDMRAAIRAQITSQPARVVEAVPAGMIDDLVGLFQARWLQAGLAALAIVAYFSCSKAFDGMEEFAFLWQLHAPTLFGI